jgi:hypothetical protein
VSGEFLSTPIDTIRESFLFNDICKTRVHFRLEMRIILPFTIMCAILLYFGFRLCLIHFTLPVTNLRVVSGSSDDIILRAVRGSSVDTMGM